MKSCIFIFFFLCLLGTLRAAEEDDWSLEESPLYEDGLDDVYDPLEPLNRLMFKINGVLDKVFLVPISMAYERIFPTFLQSGIANFVCNFFSPVAVINFILQGDGEHVVKTTFRFIINTIFGFFGFFDTASKIGLQKKETSLGSTFKKWGAKPGPYLVLPFFGPGSFRSSLGKIMQIPIDPMAQITLFNYKKNTRRRLYYVIYGANIIVKRASMLEIMMELEKTSDDMYVTTRNSIMSTEK
ncbi:MAG: VacJ family lipoprotein [Holosporales bacterium]|nr:VacJ family lipoprotein [Holosporales bacterium]